MKLINLKVLLFAALCTPFVATAQTCTIENTGSNAPDGQVLKFEGSCLTSDSDVPFRTLILTGDNNIDLSNNLNFLDLSNVNIVFESNIRGTFNENTLVNEFTKFNHTVNGAKLWIEKAQGQPLKFGFNGNGNENKVDFLNDQMKECPTDNVCSLIRPTNVFVMPVSLMSWITQIDGKQVLLNWETADELDNSHFVVSRSTDGATFTELGTIDGQGTTGSVSTYRFRDQKPATGVNYYRLEQYDYDGTRTELGVQSVDFGGRLTGNLMLSPNPVASGQVLTFAGHADGDTEVEIFAPNGSHVGNYLVQGGAFRVPTLKPGMYTLRMHGQATRLVVAR